MARVFKRKDRLSAMSEINLTSLMDLVFCLLIIFMITTPLMQEQSIAVDLPKQNRDPSSVHDPKLKYISVTIDRGGHYFLERDPVSTEELRAGLVKLAAEPEPPAIDFREDPSVMVQQQTEVLDLIKQTGLSKIYFDTEVK